MLPPLPTPAKTLKVSASELIAFDEITHLTADGNYTYIHLHNGRCYLRSKTMRYFERLLDARHFFRADKSCIINLQYVTAIKSNSIEIGYCQWFSVSRRKRKQLRDFYKLSLI